MILELAQVMDFVKASFAILTIASEPLLCRAQDVAVALYLRPVASAGSHR